MTKRLSWLSFLVAVTLASAVTGIGLAQSQSPPHNYVPSEGYVPDRLTAETIAYAVLKPTYGESVIKKELPLRTSLAHGKWTVKGSLPGHGRGGVAEITIDKKTGAILRLTHGK